MARYNRSGDIRPMMQVYAQFESRIALICLDGEASGTGFLVAEKLLLTAQHVVEAAAGIIAEPDSIEVTFDFRYQPYTTTVEAGDTVPVVAVVHHSPPTDLERSPAKCVDWEASDQYLDYAILQLQRRSPILSPGRLGSRGHYQIPFNPPTIARGQVLFLGHHPRGETIKYAHLTLPELNKNKTRIKYQADTTRGSSGGAIVNDGGQLVGLHHYASNTDKHGVPIAAVVQDLKANRFEYLIEQAPLEQNVIHLGRYSANAKRKICAALAEDWQSLKGHLGVPEFIRSAEALWDWLALNNKLRKIRDALEAAERTDLVRILDEDVVIVDQSVIDNIRDLTDQLIESAESAKKPSSYIRSAIRARILADMLLDEIKSLSSAIDDERAQLRWLMAWRRQLGCARNELKRLLPLLPSTSADASFTRSRLNSMGRAAHDVQSNVSKLGELAQSPELRAR